MTPYFSFWSNKSKSKSNPSTPATSGRVSSNDALDAKTRPAPYIEYSKRPPAERLLHAAKGQRWEEVVDLLEAGADAKFQLSGGETALGYIILFSTLGWDKKVYREAPGMKIKEWTGWDIAVKLLNVGADPDMDLSPDNEVFKRIECEPKAGAPLLVLMAEAVDRGSWPAMELVLKKWDQEKKPVDVKAKVNEKDGMGQTALHKIIECCSYWISNSERFNFKFNERFKEKIKDVHVIAIHALMVAGADREIKDNEGRTPLTQLKPEMRQQIKELLDKIEKNIQGFSSAPPDSKASPHVAKPVP